MEQNGRLYEAPNFFSVLLFCSQGRAYVGVWRRMQTYANAALRIKLRGRIPVDLIER
jgi:hypothetical protein